MSKREKTIRKIMEERSVSFEEAQSLLIYLGYEERSTGSHHIFTKDNYTPVNLKKRTELLPYQLKDLQGALKKNGY